MLTDPIADFITRLRNASMVSASSFVCPSSKQKVALCKILKKEKIITSCISRKSEGKLYLKVKFNPQAILYHKFIRRSKPGSRIYLKARQIPRETAKSYISIISTNQGVMTAKQAKKHGLGGEWLVEIS